MAAASLLALELLLLVLASSVAPGTAQACIRAPVPQTGTVWPASCAGSVQVNNWCTGSCRVGYVGAPRIQCLAVVIYQGEYTHSTPMFDVRTLQGRCQPACRTAPPAVPGVVWGSCANTVAVNAVCTGQCLAGFAGAASIRCIGTPGPTPRFALSTLVTNCSDVNECATGNGGCAQVCTNTVGGYFCSCNPPYTLNADGKRCDYAFGQQVQRVLVVAADNPDWVANVRGVLNGTTGAFAVVDTFDAAAATPTLAQLQPYDAALVYSNDGFFNATALGDVLADYWDGGGRVCLATFANTNPGTDLQLQGRWSTDNFTLIDPLSQKAPPETAPLLFVDPTNLLLAGVVNLTAQAAFQSAGGLINGGVAVARWGSSGGLLIVRGSKNGRQLVELNMFPPSSAIDPSFWAGSGGIIMANALKLSG